MLSRRVGGPWLTGLAAGLLLLAGGGCSAAPPASGPAAAPLSEEETAAFASLLRLEDRREFEAAALSAAAGSASPRLRARAALALGRIGGAEGPPLLLPLLQDPDTAVAATAAFALGLVGDTTAVPGVAALLTPETAQRSPTVASEAAFALGRLPSAAARSALSGFLAAAPVDDARVAEAAGSALLAIWRFPRLARPDPIARWTGVADDELRWRATYALVRRPDPAAVPLLLRLAGDPAAQVRAMAVRGLTAPLADSAGVARDAVLPVLVGALADSSYPVRVNAARALGGYPGPVAAGALQRSLADPSPHLALAAAEALGRLGAAATPAIPALQQIALADSAPPALRQAALEAAARVAAPRGAEWARRLAGDRQWRVRLGAARASVVAEGPRAAVDRFLRDPDPRVGAAVLEAAVAAAGDSLRGLRAPLLEALGMPDMMVRAAALGGLRRLADPTTLPVLLDAYARAQRDSTNDAALAAIDAVAALRREGLDPARVFLARFDRPTDPLLRARARQGFGQAAERAWGPALPVETEVEPEAYRALVERGIAAARQPVPGPRAVVETEAGMIQLRLFAADAPLTVANFVRLAERGYFDGQQWPRVVPNFVVQGGDPRGDTSGGPGYSIRDEINRRRYGTGTLGMALSGPDTGGSQFFITHSPQPHLDGEYTIFGEVVGGQAVTERILPGERILSIRILD